MSKTILILFSGGLDSVILERYAKVYEQDATIKKVWFDIGQDNAENERSYILKTDCDIRKVEWNATPIGKEGNACGNIMIPGRNGVLAMLVASIYLPDEIWMGGLKGEDNDDATDKNQEFIDKFNDFAGYVLSPYKESIKLRFPFVENNMGKFNIVSWALNNNFSSTQLLETKSCLSSKGKEIGCGECIVCARRWGIFYALDIKEEFQTHPMYNLNTLKYVYEVMTDKSNHYNDYRKEEFYYALEKWYQLNTNVFWSKQLKIITNKLKEDLERLYKNVTEN
jgi:7-cyano-7-deazaguanine synthase in queuosine biosynthesis